MISVLYVLWMKFGLRKSYYSVSLVSYKHGLCRLLILVLSIFIRWQRLFIEANISIFHFGLNGLLCDLVVMFSLYEWLSGYVFSIILLSIF